VFAHGWFGRATGDAGDTFRGFSDSGLTFGGGGGVDVAVTPRWAIRGQYDWLGSFADIVEANSRMAVGVVWRSGNR
jgi:opacity protein-like surface antigen